MITVALFNRLPERYAAAPSIHLGSSIEIDVATFEEDQTSQGRGEGGEGGGGGGVAIAVWAPPRPTLVVATDLPAMDEYEVRVYDTRLGRRLVAAVEIVSPGNKDRPEHRRACRQMCCAAPESCLCRDRRSRHDPRFEPL